MLLLGCGGESRPQPDAVYLLALGQELPDTQGLVCEDIPTPARRGECLFFAAREQGWPEGEYLCPVEGPWAEICRFELVDQGGLVGEEARRACAGTGAFEPQCRAHALQRELELLARTEPPWDTAGLFAAWGIEEDPVVLAALHAASGEPCPEGPSCELVDVVLASWSGEQNEVSDRLGAWRMRERPRWMRAFPPR